MKSKPHDYLKFWRVIRYYVKAKHKLSQADLDIILFLYSEGYFGQDSFEKFVELVSWDINRFKRLKREGWIELFRKRSGKKRALYQLSYKATRLVLDIYRKLNGEEIPVSKSANPMFLKNVSYNDKVYRNMILEMNAYNRAQNKLKKTDD
ncbi:MAG: hypothetical protein ACK5DE_04145 [Bacteroidota bacterium]|jgi:predicted HTH domain antitoxin